MGDVVIVGGGVMGLSLAFRLATRGSLVRGGGSKKIRVLEKGSSFFFGASGASLGALWSTPLGTSALHNNDNKSNNDVGDDNIRAYHRRCHRESLSLFPTFLEELRTHSNVTTLYRNDGHIELMTSERQRARLVEHQTGIYKSSRAVDPEFEYVPPEEIASFFEQQHFFSVIDDRCAPYGLLYRRKSAQVHIESLREALLSACERLGVILQPDTNIIDLHFASSSQRVVSAITDTGRAITGDRFVLTAGAWTPQIHQLVSQCAPVVPSKGQALEVSILSSSTTIASSRCPIVKRGSTYVVAWPERNMALIGSTSEPEVKFFFFV